MLLEKYPDRELKANIHSVLGKIATRAGRYRHAIDFFLQSIAVDREIGHYWNLAAGLVKLGIAYVALGQYEQASVVRQEARQLYREQGYDAADIQPDFKGGDG